MRQVKASMSLVSIVGGAFVLWVHAGGSKAIVWSVDVRVGVARVDGDTTSRTIGRQLHDFNSRFVAFVQTYIGTDARADRRSKTRTGGLNN